MTDWITWQTVIYPMKTCIAHSRASALRKTQMVAHPTALLDAARLDAVGRGAA